MKKKRKIRRTAAKPAASPPVKKQKADHLHILLVSTVLALACLFVVTGIGIVGIQGSRNGIDSDNPPVSIRQQEELLYQISCLGETAVIDLSPLNQAVGFLHCNSFLIPSPFLFVHQLASAVYLACTDNQLFWELFFPKVA